MSIITIPKPLREKLGDDGTEGLIDVLNRQEEQTNDSVIETAASRFERRLTEVGTGLDTRITEVESGMRVEISDAEKRFERRLTEEISTVNAKILKVEERITEEVSGLRVEIFNTEKRLDNRITEVDAGLRVEIHKSKTDTIKWMFIFYIGQVAALGGILFAVLR